MEVQPTANSHQPPYMTLESNKCSEFDRASVVHS